MKRKLIASLLTLILLSQIACSSNQINRAVSLVDTAITITQSLHLQGGDVILRAIQEIRNVVVVFRDNPTVSNYQNALNAITSALNSGVFNISPKLRTVIQAIQLVFTALVPQGVMADSAPQSIIDVKDLPSSAVDKLEAAVKELKKEVKK